ncbi:MAG: hypothetical protein V7720_04030 [Halioglobus sp.]
MTNFHEPTLLSLISSAKRGQPDAASKLLQYAAATLPEGNLHPRVAEWLATALNRVVDDPPNARRALGLSGKQNSNPITQEALSARNVAIGSWADSALRNNEKTGAVAEEFLKTLRPGGKGEDIDMSFVNKIHDGELKQKPTHTVIDIVVSNGVVGFSSSESKEVRAALIASYKKLSGKSTVVGILEDYLEVINSEIL